MRSHKERAQTHNRGPIQMPLTNSGCFMWFWATGWESEKSPLFCTCICVLNQFVIKDTTKEYVNEGIPSARRGEGGWELSYLLQVSHSPVISVFLWHNKFSELPPFGLLHRWCDIRMIHQISAAFSPLALGGRRKVLNFPIPCDMTTWELSRKSPIKMNTGELGRDWCSWQKNTTLTSKGTRDSLFWRQIWVAMAW